MPPVEIAIGLCLVIGVAPLASALAGIGTLLVFSIAVAADLRRGHTHPCGCLGKGDTPIRWRLVYRNLVLAAALVAVFANDPSAGIVSPWLGTLVATSTALAVFTHITTRVRVGTTAKPEEQLI